MLKNVFDRSVTDELIARIQRLTPTTRPQWGKMDVAQMLAHCSRPYDSIFDPAYLVAHPKPNAVVRFLLKTFLKQIVVGEKAYARNSRTASEFIVADKRNLDTERAKLIGYLNKVQSLGSGHFAGKESHAMGPLSSAEWSNLFYKHLDHHLTQFGV
jgi:hypothetical protein